MKGKKVIIKQAIFDLDGTLLQTMNSLIKTGNLMLEKLGYPGRDVNDYRYFVGYGAKELVRRLLIASGDEQARQLDKAYESYMALFEETCTFQVEPYPGIPELINFLKKQNIKLAVLTNKPHEMAKKVIAQAFSADTFSYVQGQSAEFPRKPDPTSALFLADKIGAEIMREVLFIGDSDADMETAVNADMIPVGASWGFRTPQELLDHGCEVLLEKPSDLISWIKNNG